MKMLMFQAPRFQFRAGVRTLEGGLADGPDDLAEAEVTETSVVFVHAEPDDEARAAKVVTKGIKHIKWLSNKRGLKRIVLHSFNHLAEHKAEPQLARRLLDAMAERLQDAGYHVVLTPFGYSCEWELSVYPETLAKVFKSF